MHQKVKLPTHLIKNWHNARHCEQGFKAGSQYDARVRYIGNLTVWHKSLVFYSSLNFFVNLALDSHIDNCLLAGIMFVRRPITYKPEQECYCRQFYCMTILTVCVKFKNFLEYYCSYPITFVVALSIWHSVRLYGMVVCLCVLFRMCLMQIILQ